VSDTVQRLTAALADRYRIERELGQGGMATVYLALDIRHARRVALKILRPELAAVIGAERFLTEITTTANLQHPHILPLHDSGEAGGSVFYVMPYIEGESLRNRLDREKQLPVEDAVRITREIAAALDYAHRHGVIHRDIKPENILLHDGSALVADFGIALAVSRSEGSSRMTETGMSLGTPHYMSPEQAMGERELSPRSDVYALGCVLYEMLVGEPPFTGPTPQAIVAKVITEKPPFATTARESVPRHVARAIQKSLSKLPADRFGSAAELSTALASPGSFVEDEEVGSEAVRRTGRRGAVIGLGVLALALAAVAAWGWLRPEPAPVVTASYIKFAPREAPLPGTVDGALSRDGSMLVYVGPGESSRGIPRLWLKRRSELRPTPIAGTDGAGAPFFSPDSRWIAFFADGRLKKVPAGGGGVVTLADAPTNFRWGGWLEGGRIIFAGAAFTLLMISEDGGTAEQVVKAEDTGPGRGAVWVVPLPGGRGFLFAACGASCVPTDIRVMDLVTRKSELVLKDAFPIALVPTGELLYTTGGGVMLAAPFDQRSLRMTGPGRPVVEGLARFGMFAVADDGTLVYQESEGYRGGSVPVWVSRDGRETPIDSGWNGDVNSVALSPDGKRLAITAISGQSEDVWVKELDRGPLTKITFGEEPFTRVRWSADGKAVLYLAQRGVLSKRADGGGTAGLLAPHGNNVWTEAEQSRDGNWILLRSLDGGKRDIYAVAAGDTVVRPLLVSTADEFGPTLSPDGKWLAFAGQEGAVPQVFVTPFPDVGSAKWQVSTDGGSEPVWSRDGRELFYVRNTDLMVAEVSTTGTFSVLSRKTLFPVGPYSRDQANRHYDVTPDGQRFVMIRTSAFATGDLVLIENWFEVLKDKLRR
jgi:serine/threonine-protein kinase